MKNLTTPIACPVLSNRVRAAAKIAAHEAAVAAHRAAYCGPVTYTICRVSAMTTHTAAMDEYRSQGCLGWHGISEVARHIIDREARAAAFPHIVG